MISFFKYHGAGNDFILLDERGLEHPLEPDLIRRMCHRHFGIGADGILLLSPHDEYDFELTLYNADGVEGSLCGNGSRCAVHAAFRMGFIDRSCRFLACDGAHEGMIHDDGSISIDLKVQSEIDPIEPYYFCDNGTPHLISYVDTVDETDVLGIGKRLRSDQSIKEEGVNVNFVEVKDDALLKVRTFERGVEDETLACGTGAVAVALVQAWKEDLKGNVKMSIQQPGGRLEVSFERDARGGFEGIRLRGPAESPFQGKWDPK